LCAIALLSATPTWGQTLYKCSTASGSTEYRNSPCEKGQRSAGAVNQGTVTTLKAPAIPAPATPAPATPETASGDSTLSKLGLSGLLNPVKALRDDAAPIDKVAIGVCNSEGGFYVEGAGCISEPPKNRNPLIPEAKMRDICQQTGKIYAQPLNDCVKAVKK
jgi:hypothetical protein